MYARRLTKQEYRTANLGTQFYPGIIIKPENYQKVKHNIDVSCYLQLPPNLVTQMKLFDKMDRQVIAIVEQTQKRIGVNLIELGSKKTLKELQCKFCGKKYNKAQALGGHISKIHSKQNRGLKKENSKVSSSNVLKKKTIRPAVPRAPKDSQASADESVLSSSVYDIQPQKLALDYSE